MAAGRLDRLITIQARGEVSDGAGNYVSDWADLVVSEPAEIKALRGKEELIAQKVQGTGFVNIRVRYSPRTAQIKESHRIVNARNPGEIYNIRYIDPPERRSQWLTITAQRGVAHG